MTSRSGSPGPKVLVEARSVSKRYGDHDALHDLELTIRDGVTGLLGPNGAGKTTFLNLVLGIERPTHGEVLVFGRSPTGSGVMTLADVGYAPEHHALPDDMSAVDLVAEIAEVHGIPRRQVLERATDALWLVGLGEERSRMLGSMSTGQRQRVKLDQAIAHDPRLLILDEPTDGLDPTQRIEVLDLIRRLADNDRMSVVLSSHLLSEAERICDEVVILHEGRVAATALAGEFNRNTNGVLLEVDSRQQAFAVSEILERVPCEHTVDGTRLTVWHESHDEALRLVRDSCHEARAVPVRLRRHGGRLEELFMEST